MEQRPSGHRRQSQAGEERVDAGGQPDGERGGANPPDVCLADEHATAESQHMVPVAPQAFDQLSLAGAEGRLAEGGEDLKKCFTIRCLLSKLSLDLAPGGGVG